MTITQAAFISKIINEAFLLATPLKGVLGIIAGLMLASIFRFIFNWLSHEEGNRVATDLKKKLRLQLLHRLNQAGPAFIQTQRSGELSNTIMHGIETLDTYFSRYIPQLFLSTLIPLFILIVVFPIDLLSGFIFLFTAPLIPVFMILIGHAAQGLTRKQWKTLSRMSAHFLDVLQGLVTLKLLGRSKDKADEIKRISNAFRKTTMNVLKIAFLSALVLEMAATISTAIIAVEIGLRLMYARIPFEEALFILILAPEFYQPLRDLGARFHAGMEGANAAQRIFRIFERTAPSVSTSGQPPKSDAPSTIKSEPILFHNVTLRYVQNRHLPAIEEVNLNLKPRNVTALVGSTGSGKSTIARLLLKFLEPSAGVINIGSQNLQAIDSESWRRMISWVPQSPYLFNASIAENLRLAAPGASDETLMQAADKAHFGNVIRELPEGLQTAIGERGTRLSGGQAQRLALARAFLKDSPLLILDEPTSNLDPYLEERIRESLQSLMAGKTTLFIAHRLATVTQADYIYVLDKGRIIEHGNHNHLIKKEGAYFQLLRAHKGNF